MRDRFLFLLLAGTLGYGQGIINTFAGGGNTVRSDGLPATSAALGYPNAVAVDAAGNVYIGDKNGYGIRKVNTAGIISTVPGTVDYQARGLAIDAAGNIYFSDPVQRVRRVTPAGVLTVIAGTGAAGYNSDGGPATSAWLHDPTGLALDAAGNLFIADSTNHRVRKVTPAGVITTVTGNGTRGFSGDNGPAVDARIGDPSDLVVDSLGNLYIGDYANNRIRRIDPAGIITTFAGSGNPVCCTGDGIAATSANINQPNGLGLDGTGNVYIADTGNTRILKVDSAGKVTTMAGGGVRGAGGDLGDGGPAVGAYLQGPLDIALDSAGNLYIPTGPQYRVRKVTAEASSAPAIRAGNPVLTSFGGKAGFSSNTYVEIYGENLSPTQRLWGGADFNGAHAPTSLDGVRVTVNGKPAFIYYISANQININTPDDTATGPVTVQVRTPQGMSNPVIVDRARLSPTLQTVPQFLIGGKQYIAALTPDFSTFIGRPGVLAGVNFALAKPGDMVSLYALGCGPTTPATQAGTVAAQASAISSPYRLRIGGQPATVSFAGIIGGTIGLYQFNVVIPNVPAGDQTIDLEIDGVPNAQNLVIAIGQ